ncbi:DNA repair protein RadC [Candidatus Woesebacteria bacterium]|nr:DNA repair protein RadC [Candidatus Woesebacteria bacterium]
MNIKLLPKHKRPREKLIAQGAQNLKSKELLAILFRTGKKGKNAIELSADILKKHPISSLLDLSYEELLKIDGIDAGKACGLLAAFELARRAMNLYDGSRPLILSQQDALDQIGDIRTLKKEHFVALYLNARNELIYKETISVGTLNISIVHPREVFEPALRHQAIGLILVHNHPSGDTQPSTPDLEITKRLVAAGNLLGIEIMDHIIVGRDAHFSFKEAELL